jgi:hypothetical protein
MKKPRADAILLNLPADQEARLAAALLGGLPYHQALILVRDEFGVDCKSITPLQAFWRKVCRPLLLGRRQRLQQTAQLHAAAAERHPARFDEAIFDAIRLKAYQAAISPDASLVDAKTLLRLALKLRDQELDQRRIALSERRIEHEFPPPVQTAPLSPEEYQKRLREIFAIDPDCPPLLDPSAPPAPPLPADPQPPAGQ